MQTPSLEALKARVAEQFTCHYGSAPTLLAIAPGRVNVIGEHVDYNGGWVLPAAIERYMVMAVRQYPFLRRGGHLQPEHG